MDFKKILLNFKKSISKEEITNEQINLEEILKDEYPNSTNKILEQATIDFFS